LNTPFLGIMIDSAAATRAARELDDMGRAADRAEREVDNMVRNVVSGMNRMNGSIEGSRKATDTLSTSMRRFGSGTVQNVSWQVADLSTQLNNGTAASVAFGQQIPQIAASFGPAGAVIGAMAAIAIPAFVLAMGSAGDSAEEVSDTLKAMNEVVESSRATMKLAEASAEELAAKYGIVDEAVRKAIEGQKQVDLSNVKEQVLGLKTLFGDLGSQEFFQTAADGMGTITKGAADIYGQYMENIDAAMEFNAAIAALSEDADIDSITQQLVVLRGEIQSTADENGELPENMQDFADRVQEALNAALDLRASASDLTGETLAAERAAAALAASWEKAAANVRDFRRAEAEGLRERQRIVQGYHQFSGMVQTAEQTAAAELEARKIQTFANTMEKTIDDAADAQEKARREAEAEAKRAAKRSASAANSEAKKAQREMEREIELRERVISGLEFERDMIGVNDTARRAANEARRAGVDIMSKEGQYIQELVFEIEQANYELERMEEVNNFLADSATDLWESFLEGGDSVRSMLADLALDLSKMAANRLFMNILTNSGMFGGGGGGFLSEVFGIGAEQRATGGPVRAGMPYIVGEKRAELFVPDQNGTILPHVPRGSGGGATSMSVGLKVSLDIDDSGRIYHKIMNQSIAASAAMVDSAQEANHQSFNDRVGSALRHPRKKY